MYPNNTRVTARVATGLVTLAELKEHLNLFDNEDFDDLLTRLITVSEHAVENYTGEYLSNTTIRADYAGFASELILPQRFVSSVSNVTHFDDSNMSVTVPAATYLFDNRGAQPAVRLRVGETWTSSMISRDYSNPVSVTYVASIAEGEESETLKQAILMNAAGFFQDRENYVLNQNVNRLHLTAERLVSHLRREVF